MQRLKCYLTRGLPMRKKFIVMACLSILVCSCEQKQMDMKKMDDGKGSGQKMDDQKDMNQSPKPQTGGCCSEAEKPASTQQAQTAAAPEVKVEKTQ